ncbi:hypothetical protein OK351_01950 [Glutamicibacter sp. MNS18]|uniref:hypothetical protein n=1 Tax=Glutamicibacter sp. MNS18 TaxID=2989817 RepID=UPI0022354EE4|nr:hypothetical protein [Glutamicibacter sp. MNS18]MCW4464273.1 hypothetical protein [Glutamicibacter sp. MNS18]
MDSAYSAIEVRFGGQPRDGVLELLDVAGVQLNSHAETLLEHPSFDHPSERTMLFTCRVVAHLGLPDGGTLSQIFASALNRGLNLVPLEAAPYLRLAYSTQPNAPDSELSAGRAPDGSIHIASEPVGSDVMYPKGFYLRIVDEQAWLRGYRCDDSYVFDPEQQFLFTVPTN